MAATERQRLELQRGLLDVLEEGPVTTLMDSLPPMDWHELATKTDLAALEGRMDAKFDAVDAKFEALCVAVGAGFERVGAKFERVEAAITAAGGEAKRDLAKQTYVILAGVAAIAAPVYIALFIALFSGGGG